ncbi:FCD domain protein [compost metagenome]
MERERACLAAADTAGLIAQNQHFHLRLAEFAGNDLLLDFLRGLLTRSALNIALSKGWAYSPDTCRQQLAILSALESRNAQQATELMIGHLNGMFARLHFAPPPTTDLQAAFKDKLGRRRPRSYVSTTRES